MDPELVIIDGTAMLFRAYHGMGKVRAPGGMEIGGVLGACQALAAIMKRAHTRHVVAVFDGPDRSTTFRVAIDPDYKANRKDPPADLTPQVPLIQRTFAALGFATFCAPGFEADDLCATLVRLGRAEGLPCWLVTPDKDVFQLVDDSPPSVRVYQRSRRAVVDGAGVRERLGVAPTQVVDYLALTGDSSDHIAGVRGVGPKAAVALLEAFGSLDAIFEDLERVATLSLRGARSLATKLAAGRADAELARRLVTLRDDVPLTLPGPLAACARWVGPRAEADALCAEFGMQRPLATLRRVPR